MSECTAGFYHLREWAAPPVQLGERMLRIFVKNGIQSERLRRKIRRGYRLQSRPLIGKALSPMTVFEEGKL